MGNPVLLEGGNWSNMERQMGTTEAPNGRQMGTTGVHEIANPRKSIKSSLSNVLLSKLKSEKINPRRKMKSEKIQNPRKS